MPSYNDLQIEAYLGGSTTPIIDPSFGTERAHHIKFETYYPGGLFGPCSFDMDRRYLEWWEFHRADRLVFCNGMTPVWEGKFDSLDNVLEQNNKIVHVTGSGQWRHYGLERRMRKVWADQRLDANIWIDQTEAEGTIANAEKYTVNVNRENGLRLVPQSGQDWAQNEYYAIRYTLPAETVGYQSIKRVTFTWKFSQGSQNWKADLWDVTNSASLWTQDTTNTTGTAQDIDTSTPLPKIIEFRLTSQDAGTQKTPDDQSVYLYIYSLTVYTELGNINPTEIIKDIRYYLDAALNADESYIDSNTLSLVPFLADTWEPIGNLLMRVSAFGDSNYDPWAAGFLESEKALTPDGQAVVYFERQPYLTDYDLIVSMSEMVKRVTVRRDWAKMTNWQVVQWRDAQNRIRYDTPYTDAALKNDTSISEYEQRDTPVNILNFRDASQTRAKDLAKRHLAQWNTPKYNLTEPIQMRDYVRGKNGNIIPACEVRAGMRIMIDDYLDDLSGTGMTLLITKTAYDDETKIVSMTSGVPDDFATRMAQLEYPEGKPRDAG